MMRILILGGSGMLGHRLWIDLSEVHEAWITIRGPASRMPSLPGTDRSRIREGVDMLDFDNVIRVFAAIRPSLVINCVGLVKQHSLSKDPLLAIELNARLPHRLSLISHAAGIRMIHISTDCVFSGKTGHYTEDSPSDAEDLYGRSKSLGELSYPHTVTVRTSIIGREIRTRYGLTEWFLCQQQAIRGFTRAIFSGFTTQAFAKILLEHFIPKEDLSGIWHVSSAPISKYELLCLMRDSFRRAIEVIPDDTVVCNRSLECRKFQEATGFTAPAWSDMVEEMVSCSLPYDDWKR